MEMEAKPNRTATVQTVSSDTAVHKPRQQVYERPQLSAFILGKVAQATVPLYIARSPIHNAGSGLFVTKPVLQGEEIFRSRPLMLCREAGVDDVCDWCFVNRNGSVHPDGRFYSSEHDERPTVSRCAKCKVARYCSRACQKSAWIDHHKFECSDLQSSPNTPSACLMTQRILRAYEKGALSALEMGALTALETHFSARDAAESNRPQEGKEEDEDDGPDSLDMAMEVQQRVKTRFPLQTIWALQCMVLTNAFGIRPAEKELTYGAGLDFAVSLINHSCLPNAHVFVEGREVRVRALRPLRAGDEITVAYVEPCLSVLDRREKLSKIFFLHCSCRKCKADIAEYLELIMPEKTLLSGLKEAQDALERLSFKAEQAYFGIYPRQVNLAYKFEQDMQAVTRRVFPQGEWPDYLPPMPEVLKKLSQLYEDSGHASHLRYLLRGTLYSRRVQTGPAWVNDLFTLVMTMIRISQHPEELEIWTVTVFPTRYELRSVGRGYLQRLCLDAQMLFGNDTSFVCALHRFADTMLNYNGDPPIGTEAFKRDFGGAQAKLLHWAVSDVQLAGITLPMTG